MYNYIRHKLLHVHCARAHAIKDYMKVCVSLKIRDIPNKLYDLWNSAACVCHLLRNNKSIFLCYNCTCRN